jgi:hypothetical protein
MGNAPSPIRAPLFPPEDIEPPITIDVVSLDQLILRQARLGREHRGGMDATLLVGPFSRGRGNCQNVSAEIDIHLHLRRESVYRCRTGCRLSTKIHIECAAPGKSWNSTRVSAMALQREGGLQSGILTSNTIGCPIMCPTRPRPLRRALYSEPMSTGGRAPSPDRAPDCDEGFPIQDRADAIFLTTKEAASIVQSRACAFASPKQTDFLSTAGCPGRPISGLIRSCDCPDETRIDCLCCHRFCVAWPPMRFNANSLNPVCGGRSLNRERRAAFPIASLRLGSDSNPSTPGDSRGDFRLRVSLDWRGSRF